MDLWLSKGHVVDGLWVGSFRPEAKPAIRRILPAKRSPGIGMPYLMRTPALEELPALSALCFRSKAIWGYDDDFMEMCRRELSFDALELRSTSIVVAEEHGKIVGVAQVKVVGKEADLLKLFVEPSALSGGVGRALLAWAAAKVASLGADKLVIEADPDAAPFYRRMGAEDCGVVPSGSIAGRLLPKLVMDLSLPSRTPLPSPSSS
ncbi:GNAT family N-acetyltransferase [Bradyrhizobium sp. INPA01-394B]|uniref:GNAT family N-acetyltransferase n=1 Tax=Bradyrhizobium campsiandrae TaxID=1729892 RepID=A0ABR7UA53_9BRAD|nr:GNAT family N-acetyltransferase [Bradyrhizobium campsiandrae]MBC9878398.1 GNAT family N-acetyltransferase [Bradyrhizobium campsiandrae]MBC9980322.1 GNAT family N-acetyltransferase [Bradyrhizobium campsiandrae]